MNEVADKARSLRKSVGQSRIADGEFNRKSTMLTGGETAQKNKAYVRRSDLKEEQYGYYSDDSYSNMDV